MNQICIFSWRVSNFCCEKNSIKAWETLIHQYYCKSKAGHQQRNSFMNHIYLNTLFWQIIPIQPWYQHFRLILWKVIQFSLGNLMRFKVIVIRYVIFFGSAIGTVRIIIWYHSNSSSGGNGIDKLSVWGTGRIS